MANNGGRSSSRANAFISPMVGMYGVVGHSTAMSQFPNPLYTTQGRPLCRSFATDEVFQDTLPIFGTESRKGGTGRFPLNGG